MISQNDEILQEAMNASSYALGDEDFREEVEAWVKSEAEMGANSGDVVFPQQEHHPDLGIIETVISEVFRVSREALRTPRCRAGGSRAVFMELACTLGGRTQREVARSLGGVTEHAVSKARSTLREQLREDTELANKMAEVTEVLKARL